MRLFERKTFISPRATRISRKTHCAVTTYITRTFTLESPRPTTEWSFIVPLIDFKWPCSSCFSTSAHLIVETNLKVTLVILDVHRVWRVSPSNSFPLEKSLQILNNYFAASHSFISKPFAGPTKTVARTLAVSGLEIIFHLAVTPYLWLWLATKLNIYLFLYWLVGESLQ